jgi:predicted phosphodiesterase
MTNEKQKNAVILLLADLQFGKSIFCDYLEDIPIPTTRTLSSDPIAKEVGAAIDLLKFDIEHYDKDGIPKPNIIVIAGDIVYGIYQKDPEKATTLYKAARDFIIGICEELDICKDKVIIVPGNHDVYRVTKATDSQPEVLSFDAYCAFYSSVIEKESELTTANKYEAFKVDDYMIYFHAFNTVTGGRQGSIEPTALEDKKQNNYTNIAVWHHNPSGGESAIKGWNNETYGKELMDNFDFLLHGHTHKYDLISKDNNMTMSSNKKKCCSIGSGSFGAHHNDRTTFTGNKGPAVNSYTIIELDKAANFMRLYSRMYEPIKNKWIPHNTYEVADGRYADRKTFDLGTHEEIKIASPIILVGDEMIRSSINSASNNAVEIHFYGKLNGKNLADIGIDEDSIMKKVHFHSDEIDSTVFSQAGKCKYIQLKTDDWVIEFYNKQSSDNDGKKFPKSFFILNSGKLRYAYIFSGTALSNLFALDAIELKHEKQIKEDQPKEIKKYIENVCMKFVKELEDGYYKPPLPTDGMMVHGLEGWQQAILSNYALHGKGLFAIDSLKEILITWDISFDKRSSLVNVSKFQEFIQELNKLDNNKIEITRIFFINDGDINNQKMIEIEDSWLLSIIPEDFIISANGTKQCSLIVLFMVIRNEIIGKGFKGKQYFIPTSAFPISIENGNGSIQKEIIKDIAYYLKEGDEILTVQDSKIIDSVLRMDGKNSDGKNKVLKVFFRKASTDDKTDDNEDLAIYKRLLINQCVCNDFARFCKKRLNDESNKIYDKCIKAFE